MPHSTAAIIGAGPFGVSVAAHLRFLGVDFRIFGTPMERWRTQMPQGMFLKSEAFASNLADPSGESTLERFCVEAGVPYPQGSTPVPIETFTHYALSFQKRFAPEIEEVFVTAVNRRADLFELRLGSGEVLTAAKVVVATGLAHAEYIPPELSGLPADLLSHSSNHRTLTQFKGYNVVVIGGGQSALETAALLNESSANVRLAVRAASLKWNPTPARRSLGEKIAHPRSALGNGRRLWFYSNKPQLFRYLPEKKRIKAVRTALGPAGAWWLRERVSGRLPILLEHSLRRAEVRGNRLFLPLHGPGNRPQGITADHVIAATGYSFSVGALPFLGEGISHNIRCVGQLPWLSPHFESSVPGLYFVGLASAHQFGPVMRFLFGAHHTARSVSRHIAGAPASSLAARVERPLAAN